MVTGDNLAGTLAVTQATGNDGLNLAAAEQFYQKLRGYGVSLESILHAIVKLVGYLADGEPLKVVGKLDSKLKLDKALESLAAGGSKALSLIQGRIRQGKVISAGLKEEIITDALVSAEDSNHNDAKISWIKVSYIDQKGKRIEDNIGEQVMGAEFSKEYQIPRGKAMTVTVRAEQTGETKVLAQEIQRISDLGRVHGIKQQTEIGGGGNMNDKMKDLEQLAQIAMQSIDEVLNYYRQSGSDHKGLAGKRVRNAKVRLVLELLQDGEVIGSKEVEAEKQVEATSVVYVGL